MTRLALAALLATCAACTSSQGEDLPDSTIHFHPAASLIREPAQCGVTNPMFQDADLYDLQLVGDMSQAHPTVISVTFHRTLPETEPLPVDLEPFGLISYSTDQNGNMTDEIYGQVGTLPFQDNSFEWSQSSDVHEVDATALTDTSFSIDAMPAADGDAGTFTLRMDFQDGGIYDTRLVEPLTTAQVGCPAG